MFNFSIPSNFFISSNYSVIFKTTVSMVLCKFQKKWLYYKRNQFNLCLLPCPRNTSTSQEINFTVYFSYLERYMWTDLFVPYHWIQMIFYPNTILFICYLLKPTSLSSSILGSIFLMQNIKIKYVSLFYPFFMSYDRDNKRRIARILRYS